MIIKSTRKNYLLNSSQSVIRQRRQESSSISQGKKSTSQRRNDDSLQIDVKYQLIKKKAQRGKRGNKINRKNQALTFRPQYITPHFIPQKFKRQAHMSPKKAKDQCHASQQPNTKEQSANPETNFKLTQSKVSIQQHTNVVSSGDNGQNLGFVRFSQPLISTDTKYRKQSSRNHSSNSILKKRVSSCNKININVNLYKLTQYFDQRKKSQTERPKYDAIKTKYQKILNQLKESCYKKGKTAYTSYELSDRQKYTDQLFPPNKFSIFNNPNKLPQKVNLLEEEYEICWRRIAEFFDSSQKLVLFKENSQQIVIKGQMSIASNDFILAFNAIRRVNPLFAKVFSQASSNVEQHGIYCLKISQQNCWKSIIIDDYIPAIVSKNSSKEGNAKPLFLDVDQLSKNGQQIEIWPFLLEKAYASYYNSYESLYSSINIVDWLEQLLMTPSSHFHFPDDQEITEENIQKLNGILSSSSYSSDIAIVVSVNIMTKEHTLIEKGFFQGKQLPGTQVIVRTNKNVKKMKIKNLLNIFHEYHLFLPFYFSFYNTSQLSFPKRILEDCSCPMSRIKYRKQVLVRAFEVQTDGQFSVSVRQKQKRFYEKSAKKYGYIWNRLILVKRQFNSTYRWIQGSYSNKKTINFNQYLQKGKYQVLCLPESSQKQAFQDMTLLILSKQQVCIDKKLYLQSEGVLELACADVAQRFGTFRQINQNMCSYSYIERSAALIIQNINNQRQTGGIVFSKSIVELLKAKQQIQPFNMDFVINDNESDPNKRKFKKIIQVVVDSGKDYSVVLMMKRGIDSKFLKAFKFQPEV